MVFQLGLACTGRLCNSVYYFVADLFRHHTHDVPMLSVNHSTVYFHRLRGSIVFADQRFDSIDHFANYAAEHDGFDWHFCSHDQDFRLPNFEMEVCSLVQPGIYDDCWDDAITT